MSKRHYFILLVVLFSSVTPFFINLNGELFFDDKLGIRENPYVSEGRPFADYFVQVGEVSGTNYKVIRPLTFISHRVNYLVAAGATWPFHLTNIALHLLVGATLFFFCLQLLCYLNVYSCEQKYFISLAVSSIFLVHPYMALIVNYVSDRSVLLCSLFLLLSVIAYLRKGPVVWVVLFYALALLCKETAILLPVYFIVIDMVLVAKRRALRSYLLNVYVAIIAVSVCYLGMRIVLFGDFNVAKSVTMDHLFMSRFGYLINQMALVDNYFLQVMGLHHDYVINNIKPVKGVSAPYFILGTLTLVALVAVAFSSYKKRLVVALGVLWFLASHLLQSSIFPLYLLYNPNRNYLAFFGLVLLAVVGGSGILERKSKNTFVVVWLTAWTVCFVFNIKETMNWQKETRLVEKIYRLAPENPIAVHYYSERLVAEGKVAAAQQLLAANIKKFQDGEVADYPKDAWQYHARWHSLYATLIEASNPQQALKYFRKSVEIWPTSPRLLYNLAVAFLERGQDKQTYETLLTAKSFCTSASDNVCQKIDLALGTIEEKSKVITDKFEGIVTMVKDGDSIVVNHNGTEKEIRLFGIDAPEYQQAYGEQAKEFLSFRCISKHVTVKIVTKDSFDRLVAEVFVQGEIDSLNMQLLSAGLAWWYRYYAAQNLRYKYLESVARQKGLGLWKQAAPIPPWKYRNRQNN